ncbi:hypothetical protein GGP85_002915 [Salinibacter ruber]|uniref:hypothetical protein n=1 Tax=Salinibacter ruber TaxID=146919 RepID=UPI0021677B2C|nr:hypothetical protein [Salinibacter ruber]MCS3827445.1 hypothetical protein [Salinibacter ruber]
MRSELRHLFMRHRAYERRKRREEIHLIALRNEVRGAFGADPVNPYSSTSPSTSQDTDKDEAARHAMLRQMDLDDTEEATPQDLQSLQ